MQLLCSRECVLFVLPVVQCDFFLSAPRVREREMPTTSFLLFSLCPEPSLWSRCYLQMACIPPGFYTHFWFVRNAQLTHRKNRAEKEKVSYSEWVKFKGREICMKGERERERERERGACVRESELQIKFWLFLLYERGMKTLEQGWQDREMLCEPEWKGLINQITQFALPSKSSN